MIVKVTQFLRPNGNRVVRTVEIPDEYQEQYDLIRSCNCELTCEQLTTGQAAQYITSLTTEIDYAIEITAANEPDLAKDALCKMLKEFDKEEFETWLQNSAYTWRSK